MAAPVVQSKGTANAATGTSVTPSYPASVGADDVLFLLAISHQPNGIGAIATPSGWAEVAQGTYKNSSNVDQGRAALFWRRASGSLSGTVTVTRTGDTGTDGTFYAQIYRVTGCVTSGDPWDGATPRYGPGNATVTFDAVTVSGSERTLAGFCAQADNADTVDPPSGWSGLVTNTTTTGTDAELRLLYLENVSSDGQVTATGGETEGWATFQLSLKPPAVGAALEATVSTSAASSGALTTAIAAAAALSVSAAAAGALTTAIPLAGELATSAGVSAALSTSLALAASCAGEASSAAEFTTSIPLAAAVSGTATSAGALYEAPATTALGGVDANADKLTQQTDLPASLLSAYTITGWFKRTSNAGEGGPVCVWNGSSYNTMLVTTGGMMRVGSNLGGVDVGSVTLDAWCFFALTQSGATRQLKGYIAPVGGSLSSGTHTSVNDATAVTDIIVGGGPYFGQQLRGSITEFRVWTRELSQAELEAEMAGERTPASTTDLVGRYPLLDADTKLDALVGTDLLTTGAGAWTTDPAGPFAASGAALEAAASASATAAASLTTAIPLAAEPSASASVAGQLSTSVALAAELGAAGAATGSLTTAIALAAAGEGSATLAGALSTALPLAAEASGAATVAGLLTTAIALGAGASASAEASAGLSTSVSLAAGLSAAGQVDASLTTAIALAGAGEASATAAGALASPGELQLEGALAVASSAAAELTTAIRPAAAVTVGASSSASLTTGTALAGEASCSSTAAGELLTAIALAGTGTASASAAATLAELAALSGTLACAASSSASLRLVVPRYAAPLSRALASVANGPAEASVPGRRVVSVVQADATASVTTRNAGATPT